MLRIKKQQADSNACSPLTGLNQSAVQPEDAHSHTVLEQRRKDESESQHHQHSGL